MLVRKYADDVIFYVSKQLKDRLRIVQRAVRDHYNDVAEELSNSLSDSVTSAQKAAQAGVAERTTRLAEVKRSLAQLDEVTQDANRLVAGTPAPKRTPRPQRPADAVTGGSDSPAPGMRPRLRSQRRTQLRSQRSGRPALGPHAAVGMTDGPSRANQPVGSATGLLREARGLLAGDEGAVARLDAAQERLGEPLRVAIAGKVKAGKSTLLNAFLGERVAPTDTGECTRIVTWYRHGTVPPRHRRPAHRPAVPQPVRRIDGRLILTTGGLPVEEVERIEVRWPAPALRDLTLVDTPGLASLSEELSRQSSAALTPDDSVSLVDAVVYLMRHLHATDAQFLEAFRDTQSVPNLSAMTLVVLSRADEIGSGRIDALISAARVAQRYRTDPAVRALCLDVVPVAGLLAESGRTLRQVEFEALRDLAALAGTSASGCCSPPTASSERRCPTPPPRRRRCAGCSSSASASSGSGSAPSSRATGSPRRPAWPTSWSGVAASTR
jgi:GTPase SAR1 family protein